MKTKFMSAIAGIAALGLSLPAAAETLSIGYGQDKPPFVSSDCSDGIEVLLARELFKRAGYDIEEKCMANKRLILSYVNGDIDAGVTVPNDKDGMYYTDAFSGFENFVITRTSDNYTIDSVSDLGDVAAIAWNNAAEVLGQEFADVTSKNPKYREASSQISQVKVFLSGRSDAIIIDKNIFRWLTKTIIESGELGDFETDFTYHAIFPGTLDYYIGFTDEDQAKKANDALHSMREDGTYQKILDSYLSF
ncbi:ABC transporter substrate-binding protein [Phaeobacter sp. HF9A]|uniref:substrate-binding periplasmic protein n=1 Tax=Phaeobacter sp. HF9A TaxID=2721561 RepID=UPI0014319AA9|nr:transporter substrate-binding domain-containing protein [Phaeobacter sp. HF9A]NIZ14513.1 amino acid ABC transporter substrate-binding protein [Phaeobacter sp. HF9A]